MDEDGPLAHDSPSGSFMDLDFMDELFSDGCWLETTEGFDSSQPYIALDESSLSLADADPHEETHQKETEHNLTSRPISDLKSKELTEFQNNGSSVEDNISSVQSEGFRLEGGELSRSVWIGPSSVKQKLMDALRHLRQYTKDTEVLVQIWVPTKKGDKRVLTTIDQPCLLGLSSESLVSYRYVSENYHFQVDEDSKDFLGLPGRVFLRKLPESTPDVRFFRTEEYPRKSYAKQYNISGSFGVPVFERGTGTCLGVVEVVTTSRNISYRPELETICKALEAFDLRSSHDFCPPSVKACKEFCLAAVPEISEILGSVCKKYKLPLALTWARCFKQGKGECRHFDEKFADCISTVDSACCVADRDLYEFHIASSELYLSLGQGIVGKAFVTSKQCFAADITAFSKTDYPLSHHAKVLDLHAAVAIPLRSIHGGSVDFVLELFLPKDCRDVEEQKRMWDLLPTAVQEACQNLHVVMEKELEKDISWRTPAASDGRNDEQASHKFSSPLKGPFLEGSSWISVMTEPQHKGEDACVSRDDPKESTEVLEVSTQHLEELNHNQAFSESRQLQQNCTSRNSFEDGTSPSSAGHHSSGKRKVAERRRTKTEKTISLEVLQKHFAGSLKDAAKSIGVCPTTLKRICRQHGITRWPSRKLKKVDHSLKKLQLVIDSVQGAKGSIQIGSFYTTFPELTSPQFGGSNHTTSSEMNDHSKPLDSQHDNRFINAGVAAVKLPSSSCSHSSGSSTDFSTGEKHKINNSLTTGDGMPVEDPGGVVKRTRSEAELQALHHKESKPLAKSRSHKTLPDHASIGTLPHFLSGSNQYLQDAGTFRVKASFGEDKIRFRMQPSWNFKDLQRELAKRFSIRDVCRIDLKYLDDDHEWVLLTCDADLDECKDIFRVFQSNTIKISVNESP